MDEPMFYEQRYQDIVEENYLSKDRESIMNEMRQEDERVENYNDNQ